MAQATDSTTVRRRRRAAWLGVLAVLAGVGVPLSALAAPRVAGGAGPSWSVQDTEIPPPQPDAVACPTDDDCVAVGGGTAIYTTDGGNSWTSGVVPAGVTSLDAVSCPDVSFCVAVASQVDLTGVLNGLSDNLFSGQIVISTDGGADWALATLPTEASGFTSVSCATAEDCVVVGASLDLSALSSSVPADLARAVAGPAAGHLTWRQALADVARRGVTSAAQLLRTELVGSVPVPGDRPAAAWARPLAGQPLVDAGGPAGAPVASASAPLSGPASAPVPLPSADPAALSGSTGPSVPTGLAGESGLSGTILTTTDGGTTWSEVAAVPGIAFGDVSCATATDCVAIGIGVEFLTLSPAVEVSTNGGTSWQQGTVPSSIAQLSAVSCPDDSLCVAVGADTLGAAAAVVSTDDGLDWSLSASGPTSPAGTVAGLDGVSCVSAADCLAVGDVEPIPAGPGSEPVDLGPLEPIAFATTDGGAQWSVEPGGGPDVVESELAEVDCAPAAAGWGPCTAVGTAPELGALVETTADGGATWSQPQELPTGVSAFAGLACPTTSQCVAVGFGGGVLTPGAISVTSDGGTSWTPATVPTEVGLLIGVACPTATDCVAVGGDGIGGPATIVQSTDGGTSWTAEQAPEGVGLLQAVACPTASTCVAVGGNATGTPFAVTSTDGGTTWASASLPAGVTVLGGVSCPTATTCVAVGTDVDLDTLDETNSSGPFPGGGVVLVSQDAGQTWTAAQAPALAQVVDDVSCPTASDCVAVGSSYSAGDGFVLTSSDGGETWSPHPLPAGVSALSAVACPSADDCVATGESSGLLSLLGEGGGVILTSADGGVSWSADTVPASVVEGYAVACPSVSVCEVAGSDDQEGATVVGTTSAQPPGPPVPPAPSALQGPPSYWEVAADGGIFAFGQATFAGSMSGQHLDAPVVGMAVTPDAQGYWEVAADGGVFAFGDAGFAGSAGGLPLAQPIVGMAATDDGGGYWLVARDGGVFAYGDATYYGSEPALPASQRGSSPVVALVPTPDDGGYWEVDQAGDVFAFGDADLQGSPAGQQLAQPVVGMAATPDGLGYWLVDAGGGVYAYGDAAFAGSVGGGPLARPVVGMAATDDGGGYWLAASDGGIFAYGDAAYDGSMAGSGLTAPVVGIAGQPGAGPAFALFSGSDASTAP